VADVNELLALTEVIELLNAPCRRIRLTLGIIEASGPCDGSGQEASQRDPKHKVFHGFLR